MMEIAIWAFILALLACIIVGGVAGFFITRKLFNRYLKKNPPVNEAMIRTMYQQMGRTPSEAQVRRVMKSMEEAKNK